MNPVQTGIERAVSRFDSSPTLLAAAVGGDVKRQNVEQWLKVGYVPARYCHDIRRLTDVALWDLRPDDWHRIWPMVVGVDGAPDVPKTTEAEG